MNRYEQTMNWGIQVIWLAKAVGHPGWAEKLHLLKISSNP